MFDVHPLHPSRPSPSRKLNRENRIKNACFSNSHSNIAPSNDKRPLFVQIPATSSASLVSTSLPIQCLRPSNFFFFRGIFLNSFLRDQNSITREQNSITWEVQNLSCHQNLITREVKTLARHQNSITRQLLVAHLSSNFDHASRDFACIGDKKTRARAEAAQRTSRTI